MCGTGYINYNITGLANYSSLILKMIGIFIFYGLVIYLSSIFTFEPTSTPLFWPANAIVLVCMLYTKPIHAWLYLISAGLSYFTYLEFYEAFGLVPSLLLTSANLIEIIAGYFLVRFFCEEPIQFTTPKKAIILILNGVIFNSIIGATAGTYLMASVWEAPTLINWSIWFGTGSIGYLTVLPMIISWNSSTNKKYSFHQKLEMGILFLVCGWFSYLLFSADRSEPYLFTYSIFPPLLYSSIRFDLRLTSAAFFLFIIISSIYSSQGYGPFAMGEFYREIVLIRFHLFCAITGITVIMVSAITNERNILVVELREALNRIKELSLLDELTGIANRRKFEDEMQKEWKRSMRKQEPISIIMCDIDHFKKFNDEFGHQEGDRCIKTVAKTIESNVYRSGDIVARYGGEEFIVTLLDCTENESAIIAERIRQSVEDLKIKQSGDLDFGYVTLSLGIASEVPSQEKTYHELIQKADAALYAAKEMGRNQCVPYASLSCAN